MPRNLIVIDDDPQHDWTKIFNRSKKNIRVYQTSWSKIVLKTCECGKCVLDLKASEPDNCIPFTGMELPRTGIKVDFMLIRNYPRLLHGIDFTNLLLGLHFAGVRSVNSIWSLIQATNRAVLYAALNEIKLRRGEKAFPFVNASFHDNLSHDTIKSSRFPCVVKVASSCAGYGKMKVRTQGELDDLKGILELHNDFFTIEPFLESRYDIRLQYLGGHVRAYKRETKNDAWKRNTAEANAMCTSISVTPEYKLMLEETSKLFGGLDICTVDLLRLKSGHDVILEINDSASGIWESKFGIGQSTDKGCGEDNARIRDIVITKMKALYNDVEPMKIERSDDSSKNRPKLKFLGALKKK